MTTTERYDGVSFAVVDQRTGVEFRDATPDEIAEHLELEAARVPLSKRATTIDDKRWYATDVGDQSNWPLMYCD